MPKVPSFIKRHLEFSLLQNDFYQDFEPKGAVSMVRNPVTKTMMPVMISFRDRQGGIPSVQNNGNA